MSIRFVTSNFSTKGAVRVCMGADQSCLYVVYVRKTHTSVDVSVSVYMSVCAHGEHRRVGYPPMDFHYDAMTLATGGDFYRIYPLTSRPSRVAAASSIECYFHPAARRWHEKV